MKVYVDEMPKNCDECKYHIYDYVAPVDYKCHKCMLTGQIYDDLDCHLKSLQDHDKEVRKKVCDEIRKFLNADNCDELIDNEIGSKSLIIGVDTIIYNAEMSLLEFLDQIEKGEKDE